MKTNRLLTILLLAVVTGLSAGYLALGQLRAGDRPTVMQEVRSGKVQLAVAGRDLPLGAVLRAEDVRMIDWPAEVLPLGYAGSPAELVGRGLLTPVRTNEPILSDKLADPEGGGGMPILIPAGMRAVSVRVDDVIQVAGFVTAGTRVDVLVTLERDREGIPTMTRAILQNVQVLAAGQIIERDLEGKPLTVTVITLLVSPDDAEKLTLAASEGRIQLALRGMLDLAEVNTPGARLAGLLQPPRPAGGAPRTVRVEASRSDRIIVETVRGGVRTLNTFQ
jgi:pilus assembly protein CpaB